MQAQSQLFAAQSQPVEGLVELDLQCLVHVGGGAPKGTWGDTTETLSVASLETTPAPRGTW